MNTVTVIPAVRVSEQVQPEFRVFSHEADALQIDVLRGGCILLGCTRKLTPGKTSVFRYSLKGAVGDVELRFRFTGERRRWRQARRRIRSFPAVCPPQA